MHLRAWSRWQNAAGPWRGWAVCPALTVPDVALAARVPTAAERLPAVEPILRGGGAAVVLDLKPALGVRIAVAVSRQQLAYVVLVLPRWPHASAVLPYEDLVAALVAASRHLREPDVASNVVFEIGR